ncbi:hypothetical protein DSM14862_00811 [Sulfitobacter indolifex]|uniref:Flp pilus assembly protein, pilin Flp n=1 Tax=Sulfitobacter indolifex HEL-45 TaxID=391624 RepID=A0ABM9X6P3_9RHOB|nr:hypothetical protein [Sulfitobacter indolifex]EDQ05003.1 hypothetical protein OIHEL45_09688 [Sulfitobacter indolifex HEL-45]UOA18053.1 hypothetical protein DSM14862_00811 [Sulfitobacter indolifex]
MPRFFKGFASDQSGAVSVDWVVLTAFLIGMTILLLGVFSNSVGELLEYIQVQMTS